MNQKKLELWASQSAVSKKTGIPVRTIENWIRGSVVAVNERSQVDLVEVMLRDGERKDKEIERLTNATSEEGGNPQHQLMRAQTRKLLIECDLKQLELDKAKGQVIDFEEALADFQTALLTTRAKFLALPARVSMQLAGMSEPKKINQLLTDVIDECLTALSVEFLGAGDEQENGDSG